MTIETERLENKWTIWCGLPFIPLQRNRQLARNQTEQKRNRKRILLGADAKLVESKSFGETTFVRENVIPSIQVKWMIYLQFIFAIRQNRICSILSHSALFLICHNRTALYIMLITLAAAVRWGRKKKSNEKYELMSERTGNKSLSTGFRVTNFCNATNRRVLAQPYFRAYATHCECPTQHIAAAINSGTWHTSSPKSLAFDFV